LNVLEQIMLAWQAFLYACRHLLRPGLWLPWLILGAIQVVAVVLIATFAHPAVSWAMAPVLRAIGGDAALHYPEVFRMLPDLFGRVDLVLTATLGAVAAGAATWLFGSELARGTGAAAPAGAGVRSAIGRWLAIVVINLPFNLMALGLTYGLSWWLGERDSSGLVQRVGRLAGLCGALLIQAFFIYGTALVVLGGRGVWDAFKSLPGAAGRGFFAALTLSIGAVIPLFPLQELAARSATIVDRGTPEVVVLLVLAQVAVVLVTSFVLAGAVTVVYQGAVAPEWIEPS
jgi:hypothetical protein